MFEVILDYVDSSRQAWVTGDLISKGENDGVLRLAKRKKEKQNENICMKEEKKSHTATNLKLMRLARCLI